MTVLSAQTIRKLKLITPCVNSFKDRSGCSAGLSACGYDLTLKQLLVVMPGGFVLAAASEYFDLPANVVGIIHDKSTLARLGIAVQNTVAEPGWKGYLTLEISNHGSSKFIRYTGDAICQVIFHFLDEPTDLPYVGKYQHQRSDPQPAILEKVT